MGELHATVNLTVDGCCEHTQAIADDDLHDWATTLIGSASALLFGRTTYDLLRSYWPGVAASGGGTPAEVRLAQVLDDKPKHVVSREAPAPGWKTSRVALGDDQIGVPSLAELQRDMEGMLLLVASPALAGALEQAGLIDEYHLAIQPIFAGRGPTFLAGLSSPRNLRLCATSTLRSGVVIHRYRRAL